VRVNRLMGSNRNRALLQLLLGQRQTPTDLRWRWIGMGALLGFIVLAYAAVWWGHARVKREDLSHIYPPPPPHTHTRPFTLVLSTSGTLAVAACLQLVDAFSFTVLKKDCSLVLLTYSGGIACYILADCRHLLRMQGPHSHLAIALHVVLLVYTCVVAQTIGSQSHKQVLTQREPLESG